MPNLPQEIIVDILSRLPVKSLCRFRCVSKPWRTLISDPHFAKMHLNRTHQQRILLACKSLFSLDHHKAIDHENGSGDAVEAVELDYPLKSNYSTDWVQIFGSCNGLVCIAPEPEIFFVYNPSTREFKKIPYLPISCPPYMPDTYGFGYAPSTDDYKFLRVAHGVIVVLFSLRTNSWKRLQDIPYNAPYYQPGTPLNGAIHWVLSRGTGVSYTCVIAAFDLAEERFRDLPTPGNVVDFPRFSVGVLKGCLCIFYNYDSTHNEFWVMKDYGVRESWAKMLIAVPYCALNPLCFLKNGKVLLVVDRKQFVVCNPEDGTCEDLVVHGVPGQFDSDIYVESLVSPNFSNGV